MENKKSKITKIKHLTAQIAKITKEIEDKKKKLFFENKPDENFNENYNKNERTNISKQKIDLEQLEKELQLKKDDLYYLSHSASQAAGSLKKFKKQSKKKSKKQSKKKSKTNKK